MNFIFAALFLVSWACCRLIIRLLRRSTLSWLFVPVSFLVAYGFWTKLIDAFCSTFETVGTVPHWLIAFMASLASELVLMAYVDHSTDRPRIFNRIPVSLRLGLVAILTLILLEPVFSHFEEHSEDRYVAVMLDRSASMKLNEKRTREPVEGIDNQSRQQVARKLLMGEGKDRGILEKLNANYDVRFFEFASDAKEVKPDDWRKRLIRQRESSKDELDSWSLLTDFSESLRRVTGLMPLEQLSGVIFLTDGCDHSKAEVERVGRTLGAKDIPINTIVVGNQLAVRDAEVVNVQAPQQVYEGDSIAIRASIKADNLAGQLGKLKLIANGEVIDHKTFKITSDRHRETVVFRVDSGKIGVHEYSVEFDHLPGEEIKENNTASCSVWVSKDFIRLLIVENRPRWEFRYLRNLFAGRDRSVHLQYVLLRPDRLAGVPDPPLLYASVGRAFDDCEATALPRNQAEWLKFDVIFLGDVSPDDLGMDVMKTLEKFVGDRAGTLIVLSGQSHMPHAFSKTPLEDLLPVHLRESEPGLAKSPEQQYRFRVSSEGQSNVILQQSTDSRENESIWGSLPSMYWRHPICKAKVGATVLAYASNGPDEIVDRKAQRERALVLWHRFGAGRVLQLAFDQTWRLRYGVGDKYHHQFWGQVLRWSIQERLNAGTELVRMGTDRVTYRQDDPITVRARLLDKNRNEVQSDNTQVVVYRNEQVVEKINLNSDPKSSGMLMAKIPGLKKPGKYRLQLTGESVNRLLQLEGKSDTKVFTEVAVAGTEIRSEMSDIVSQTLVAKQLADVSNGVVAAPVNADDVLTNLGPRSTFHRDRWTVPLWNLWPVTLTFLLLLSCEWLFRKSTGLI